MQENNSTSDKKWVLKVLIGLHSVNIIIQTYFLGISMHGLIFEPIDEFILAIYIGIVLPLNAFFVILISVFSHLKNEKGKKDKTYLFTFLLLLIIITAAAILNAFSMNTFQVVTVVLFSIGIAFSIGAIINLVNEFRINRKLK